MHGIILHEEYRERMKKFSPERLGRLVQNMFLIDDGEEPLSFPDDEALDVLSEVVCARLKRDITMSDRQRNNRLGKTKNNQTRTKEEPKKTKEEPKKTPITNNLLPITNNQYKENKKESDPFVEDVVSYLNFRTGRHYQVTDKTRGLINGRVKEGYTTADFKTVIDKKVREWKGTDYEKYLQPTTLFAPSHFDNYLNQPEKPSQDDMFSAFLKGGSNGEDVEGGFYPDSQDNESRVYGCEIYPG